MSNQPVVSFLLCMWFLFGDAVSSSVWIELASVNLLKIWLVAEITGGKKINNFLSCSMSFLIKRTKMLSTVKEEKV